MERLSPSRPVHDTAGHKAIVYRYRDQIALLKADWEQSYCMTCHRFDVVQVVDFHPANGEPRGMLCRSCRHLSTYQWRDMDGTLLYWLNSTDSLDMACRLRDLCALFHSHETIWQAREVEADEQPWDEPHPEDGLARPDHSQRTHRSILCEADAMKWQRMGEYLAMFEPKPKPKPTPQPPDLVEPIADTPTQKRPEPFQVPAPLFLPPG